MCDLFRYELDQTLRCSMLNCNVKIIARSYVSRPKYYVETLDAPWKTKMWIGELDFTCATRLISLSDIIMDGTSNIVSAMSGLNLTTN